MKKQPKHATTSKPAAVSLSEADHWTIRYEYLTTSATISQLATKYDRAPATISKVLSGPDYEQARSTIEATIRDTARGTLVRGTEAAADLWLQSMPVAAARGDHRPMKDLLTATQVIDPEQRTPHVTVQIGVSGGEVQVTLAAEVHKALAAGSQVQPQLPAPQAFDVQATLPTDVQVPLDCSSAAPGTGT